MHMVFCTDTKMHMIVNLGKWNSLTEGVSFLLGWIGLSVIVGGVLAFSSSMIEWAMPVHDLLILATRYAKSQTVQHASCDSE